MADSRGGRNRNEGERRFSDTGVVGSRIHPYVGSTSPIGVKYSSSMSPAFRTSSPSLSPRTPVSASPSPIVRPSIIAPLSRPLQANPEIPSERTHVKLTKEEMDWEEDLFYAYQHPEYEDEASNTSSGSASRSASRGMSKFSGTAQVSSPRNINHLGNKHPGSLDPVYQRTSPNSPGSYFPLSNPIECRTSSRSISDFSDSEEDESDYQRQAAVGRTKEKAKSQPTNQNFHQHYNGFGGNSDSSQEYNPNKTTSSHLNPNPIEDITENYSPNQRYKLDSEKKSPPYLLALQSNKTLSNSPKKQNRKYKEKGTVTLPKEAYSPMRMMPVHSPSYPVPRGYRAHSPNLGVQCPYCHKMTSANEESRNVHNIECSRKHQQKAELESSKNFRCQKCNIKVVENGRRFGLLVECNHCFCLPCIKEWRSETAKRDCPICGVLSHFVVPSNIMVIDAEKKAVVISNYKYKMKLIPCKYIESGTGLCKFGDNCHYSHATGMTSMGASENQDDGSDGDNENNSQDIQTLQNTKHNDQNMTTNH
eukprot:TRINITY_DN6515_c0_g1_i3.p1 TRINITY_DN6515_c0_g1~~TRINITY_DN6515_c0_g1_i3.p1  ORF type:complete len:534 (-),score=53.94 TRINITY_DN6515_c0_g1_i3:64-1665(-)